MLRCLLPIVLVLSSWEAVGRGGDILLRGSGVLTKSIVPHQQVTQKFAATVVMNVSKVDKFQVGYKAVFSDGNEKTLALELTEDASTGELSAQIRASSGDGENADELLGRSGVVAETETGFQIIFKKEDRSLLEVVIDMQELPTNIGIADVHMTITTNDWSVSDSSEPSVFNWQMTARLDFNALMRNDDDSYELLLEELFGN